MHSEQQHLQFDDLAIAFLQNPDESIAKTLREAVSNLPDFEIAARGLADLVRAVDRGEEDFAFTHLVQQRKALFLSPLAHQLLSDGWRRRGKSDLADLEQRLAAASLAVLLESGDGSEGRPYVVLRVSDEYDVLRYLSFHYASQGVVSLTPRKDVFISSNGGRLFFEFFQGGVL
ncbi:hypothetical protein [Tessaracoccus sp. OH4464_COT-324]|uniref:hypothetical protein n=1 Tax=Tessaracoccus sp. OH4464_COT-324 TaxID=2491059 RepID=UPI000F63645E|nr:hypothetical protein [Tessaracoccus sp. OH4464_COT-324]RRD46507.1 hypothetical protein EII42_06850 [Tessaracoccus sp. OH4464_COT-324]